MNLATLHRSISCDAISATVDAPLESLVHRLNVALGTTAIPGRPLPGMAYEHAAQLVNPDTLKPRALVMSGSHHAKPHVYAIGVEAYDSPAVYEAIRHHYTDRWTPARLDLALDLWHPEAFDLVVPQFIAYATRRDITLGHMGDWTRNKARTLYVGAKASRQLVRVYEFKQHHGYGADCRIELQLRPKSSNKAFVASRTAVELLYSADIINTVLSTLGLDIPQAHPMSPGARPPADLERKLNWLAAQALPSMLQVLASVGGDPVGLLTAIMDRKAELDRQRDMCRNNSDRGERQLTPAPVFQPTDSEVSAWPILSTEANPHPTTFTS
jgi:hypothetical protein